VPGSTRQRAAGFAIAALLGGRHAALTIGELRIRGDGTYARIMEPERDRVIARELQTWQRHQTARGEVPTAGAQAVERGRLQRKHSSFPFVIVLALATLVALIAGLVRTRGGHDERIATRLLVRAVIVAGYRSAP
jgi:hypothetical protein